MLALKVFSLKDTLALESESLISALSVPLALSNVRAETASIRLSGSMSNELSTLISVNPEITLLSSSGVALICMFARSKYITPS